MLISILLALVSCVLYELRIYDKSGPSSRTVFWRVHSEASSFSFCVGDLEVGLSDHLGARNSSISVDNLALENFYKTYFYFHLVK